MTKPLLVVGSKNVSSWSLRPWLAMKQAGVEFDEDVILLDRPTTKAEIKARSPTGRVPVLIHEGLKVWESLAICEYVAETWAPSLWPADKAARAVARSISHEMHAGFAALRRACPMNLKEDKSGGTINPEAGGDVHRILELWKDARARFGSKDPSGGPFLFGPFTIADAMYAPVVTRINTYGIPVTTEARQYVEVINALPAMNEWKAAALKES
jgi:glutathione S-transferase